MIKRSITIHGHRTSISLEAPFWDFLEEIAKNRGLSISALVAEIDDARTKALMAQSQMAHSETSQSQFNPPQTGGLSSMIRVYLLKSALEHR